MIFLTSLLARKISPKWTKGKLPLEIAIDLAIVAISLVLGIFLTWTFTALLSAIWQNSTINGDWK